MRGRAMIFGSVPRGRQSQRPCGPLGRRPLEAADPRPRHPAGAVKRKLQPAARPDDHRVDRARHRPLTSESIRSLSVSSAQMVPR
jgi:hypothetical protein